MHKYRAWVQEEDDILLRQDYNSVPQAVRMLRKKGYIRTYSAVTQRRIHLGCLPTKSRHFWSEEELRILHKANQLHWTAKKTSTILGVHGFHRLASQVAGKRSELGISSEKRHKYQYEKEEITLLKVAFRRKMSIPETQRLLQSHGYVRSKPSIYVKRSKCGYASREFQVENHKRWWKNRSPEDLSKCYARSFETRNVLCSSGKIGIPNKTEWVLVSRAIDGLIPTLTNMTYRVRLRRPNGKRWHKNPDFSYCWRGPVENGKPLLVVEVIGYGPWHTKEEVDHMANEYARRGIRCIVLEDYALRKNPDRYEKLIRREIQKLSV